MSAFEETVKAYITQMQKDPTSVWATTPPPSPAPKSLLEMIRSAKDKLVRSQRYDDAKDLRDIERLLIEKLGNEPVVLNDIEAILDDVREAKNAAARAEEGVGLIEQRLEKMEKNPLANFVHISDDGQAVLDASMLPTFDVIVKSSDAFQKMERALSEEMAKTREMDSILAGVVKKVGYVSPPAPLDQKTLDDIVANPGDYEVKMVTPTGLVSDIYIRKDELLKWLDIEIAMAETNLEHAERTQMVVVVAAARAKLATYKAVKAHIEGHE